MAQRMTRRGLGDARCTHGVLERHLPDALGNMMPLHYWLSALGPCTRIDAQSGGRKNILPSPLALCVREFSGQGKRQMHASKSVLQVLVVLHLHFGNVAFHRLGEIHW